MIYIKLTVEQKVVADASVRVTIPDDGVGSEPFRLISC